MNDTRPEGGWGLSLGAFMTRYRQDWVIQGRAIGYTARRRNANGRPRGPVLEGRTLDELADKLDALAGTDRDVPDRRRP